jgi:[glutamine synthetase] adenylyltransferase / [glutamine synthetase]-adenylyl-L-tyrosine phosphorylase
MQHGSDSKVRTTNTQTAIERLHEGGYLASSDAITLRDGYRFLRRLEQRMHIVHGSSMSLLQADAPGLEPLARRLGLHSQPGRAASSQLMDQYAAITAAVRQTYERVLELR